MCAGKERERERGVRTLGKRARERERGVRTLGKRARERERCAHAGKESERERCVRAERERERESEVCALGKRDLVNTVSIFRCIIFIFATSRIQKKHVQLGHADGCRGNKHVNRNRSRVRA